MLIAPVPPFVVSMPLLVNAKSVLMLKLTTLDSSVVPVNDPAEAAPPAGKLVNCEPSIAGSLPEPFNRTNWLFPLKVLPCLVTDVGNTPAGKVFVPVILAAVKLVRLVPLIAGRFAIVVALPVLVTSPVKLALVVTVPAVKLLAVPLIFVPTKALGVPK